MTAVLKSNSPLAPATTDPTAWAIKLFNVSPLKQRKLSMLLKMAGDNFQGQTCLDIGSDNGVISFLLRQRGGEWSSADLIPETVDSIKQLVKENVFQIDGEHTPFKDRQFDKVIIVDFLEHVVTDREFIIELARILKPGGSLIINVPNPKEGLLRKLRYLLGQTDAKHGHVRPGYSAEDLKILLGQSFKIESTHAYGRIFSELFDTLMTAALDILKGKRGKKGTVVTASDLGKLKKSFGIYKIIAPVMKIFVGLDVLVPFLHGNMLIVRAVKNG